MPCTRGDGKLHITYNEMGQGDNILITCPNGNVVVIDCGTARWDGNFFNPPGIPAQLRERAVHTVFDNCFLGTNQTINVLILTHADKDHCNELKSIFNHTLADGTPRINQIDALYHSGKINDYEEGSAAHYLTNELVPIHTYAITINDKSQTINDNPIPDSAANTAEINKTSLVAATRHFVKVLDGTAPHGHKECGVYILASNVGAYAAGVKDNSSDDNRGSIVTLIIYGDKKFLFMGDGTYHTEKFLLDKYGATISNVELLHAGHHASYNTSSSYLGDTNKPQPIKNINFIGRVNPQYLAVSAAYDSGQSLKLPRWETINNYINGALRLVRRNNFEINCWWFVPAVYAPSTGKNKKKRKTVTPDHNEVGSRKTHRMISCTGTHGVLDYDYKEQNDGHGNISIVRFRRSDP
ncbi:MAG: hypothetical protein ACOC07_21070 [Coleofasciculus sp.]|uniref:hypothetical protein n=1 Tax=Coleofasciculus sp. TaxID=3100458 RepID=UPI003A335968